MIEKRTIKPAAAAKSPTLTVIEGGRPATKSGGGAPAPGATSSGNAPAPVTAPGAAVPGAPAPQSGGANERADVARRILELAGTVAEAIDYLQSKIDPMQAGAGISAAIIKDVGEGLESLDKAATAIAGPSGADPGDARALAGRYDELSGWIDALVNAFLDNRAQDMPALGEALRESFAAYDESLSRCFRKLTIM